MGLLCCFQAFILVGITFRRWSRLYFWCLIGATCTQVLCCFSIPLQKFILKDRLSEIPLAFSVLGYLFFPPFGFLPFYSRLHLLQVSTRVLRLVLIVIIIEWIVAEIPQAILALLNFLYPESTKFAEGYKIAWEFEESFYPVVDIFLCSMYIFYVTQMWDSGGAKMKWILRYVTIMVLLMILIDIFIVIIQSTLELDWTNSMIVWFTRRIQFMTCANTKYAFILPFRLHIEIYILNMLTESSKIHLTDMQSNVLLVPLTTMGSQSGRLSYQNTRKD
jgi:hypothetical protein